MISLLRENNFHLSSHELKNLCVFVRERELCVCISNSKKFVYLH